MKKICNGDKKNLLIRPYRSSDEDDVISLWVECGMVVPHNNPKRDIEQKLKVNPEWFLVGILDEKLIATCMAGYEGHRGWINYLAVLSEYQRRGFAGRMMEAAEKKLLAVGCPKINLQIRSTNTKMVKFYKRLGYSVDDVVSMGKRFEKD